MKQIVKIVATVVVAVAVAGGLAWYVSAATPVEVRAMQAYRAGEYQAALPLLKQWMADPAVHNDKDKRAEVLAYIVDVEKKLGQTQAGQGIQLANDKPLSKEQVLAQAKADAEAQAAKDAAAATQATAQIQVGQGDIPGRVPHKVPPKGTELVTTIKDLGNFPFNPETDSTVPSDVMALDGVKIKVNGYMLPLTQAEKIDKFALVPSLVGCCFGQPPGVEHVITAFVPSDRAVEYFTDEIVVEGTLRVRIQRMEGYTNSIFELDVSSVQLKE